MRFNGILPWGTSSHFIQWHTKKGNLWCVTDSNVNFSSFHLFSVSQKKRHMNYIKIFLLYSTGGLQYIKILVEHSMSWSLWKNWHLKVFYFKISSKNFKTFSKDIFLNVKCFTKEILKNKCWLRTSISNLKQFTIIGL